MKFIDTNGGWTNIICHTPDKLITSKHLGAKKNMIEKTHRSNFKRNPLNSKSINVSTLFNREIITKKQRRLDDGQVPSSWCSFHQSNSQISKVIPKPRFQHFTTFNTTASTKLTYQLYKSLQDIKIKVKTSKLKRRFDTLIPIKYTRVLSPHEILLISRNASSTKKYVLHINSFSKPIPFNGCVASNNKGKVATLSESMVKLSNDTYWCLYWEYIK